jgi:hypothetical protein
MANQPTPGGTTAPRRQKHLMDPNNPRPVRRDSMSLDRVQTWVLSTLAVTTILHLAVGFVVAAMYVDESDLDARIGLLVIGGLCGVGSVVAGLAIHKRRLLSWWLLLGWLPALVGAYFVFWH